MNPPSTPMEIRCFRPEDERSVVALWQRWFEIARELTREVADAVVKKFEVNGQKQAYWVEQIRQH